jgi:hypothetical protein
MGPAAVAELLKVSYSAARNYLGDLVQAGVAIHDIDRGTQLKLHPDPAIVKRFLAALDAGAGERSMALRRSPARHCVNPGERYLHVLADDVRFPLVLHRRPAQRDPLVAALFGTVGGC